MWAVVIFIFSSLSGVPDPIENLPHFDKCFHVAEFTIFGFLLCRSLTGTFTPLDPESPAFRRGGECTVGLKQKRRSCPRDRGLTGFTVSASSVMIVMTIFCGAVYGVLDEAHQLFVENRHWEITDIIADSLGSAIGSFIFVQRAAIIHALGSFFHKKGALWQK